MRHFRAPASEALPCCPAGRSPSPGVGGLDGLTPPHRFKARTAASDGHYASTRAARSAGLRFAVILLSKTMDVGRDHLIHRKRSPFPYEGKALGRSAWGMRLSDRGERSVAAPMEFESAAPDIASQALI